MIRRRRKARIVAAVLGLAWLGAVGAAQPAAAETDDQRFADAVAALEIPTAPDDDLPAVGHHICDMLTSGLASNINPVPTVRGVVSTLENTGNMSRRQAGGLMKAAVSVYCPQHASVIGR